MFLITWKPEYEPIFWLEPVWHASSLL